MQYEKKTQNTSVSSLGTMLQTRGLIRSQEAR